MMRTAAGEEVDKVELGRMKLRVFAEGMQRALRTSWDVLPRPWEPGPTRGQTGVTWPDHLG